MKTRQSHTRVLDQIAAESPKMSKFPTKGQMHSLNSLLLLGIAGGAKPTAAKSKSRRVRASTARVAAAFREPERERRR